MKQVKHIELMCCATWFFMIAGVTFSILYGKLHQDVMLVLAIFSYFLVSTMLIVIFIRTLMTYVPPDPSFVTQINPIPENKVQLNDVDIEGTAHFKRVPQTQKNSYLPAVSISDQCDSQFNVRIG